MHSRNFWILLSLTFAAACQGVSGGVRAPGSSPLRFGLFQNSYWGGGFERPLFLAFSDGTVLFPRERTNGIPSQYSVIHLTPTGVDSVLSAIGAGDSLSDLDSLYDFAPGTSDQHSFFAVVQLASGSRLIQIRSGLSDSLRLRADVPRAFARVYSNVMSFTAPRAEAWTPDSIVISIWPYEYAPDDPPVAWPARWPGLADARWRRRADDVVGDIRSVRLPFRETALLDSLLKARREKQAVGISGKKWAVDYRWIFPHDSSWAWIRKRVDS